MATRGWEVSRCFFELSEKALSDSVFIIAKEKRMKDEKREIIESEDEAFDVDLTDAVEARKAFIASEIFNKKY